MSEFTEAKGCIALRTNRRIRGEACYTILVRSSVQLVAETRCPLGLVPWRGTSLGRAFRAVLPRGRHDVLHVCLSARSFLGGAGGGLA